MTEAKPTVLEMYLWKLQQGAGRDAPPCTVDAIQELAQRTEEERHRDDTELLRSLARSKRRRKPNFPCPYAQGGTLDPEAERPMNVEPVEWEVIQRRLAGQSYTAIARALARSFQWVQDTELRVLQELRHRNQKASLTNGTSPESKVLLEDTQFTNLEGVG